MTKKLILVPECGECLFDVLYHDGLLAFQVRRHWLHVLSDELGIIIVSETTGNIKSEIESVTNKTI